jgi:hypothetical protein
MPSPKNLPEAIMLHGELKS